MVLFPRSGFARLLLAVIVIATISYLVLNLVSFAGTSWITYRDAPIRFGLWRVCDTSASGLCNQWADDTFSSNITLFIFGSSKPGFIRSSQALEIISLIFYVLAAVFIILGIINLHVLPFHISFAIAAILLFICSAFSSKAMNEKANLFFSVVFLSATLGLMSVQGRSGRVGAELDWAWWNGLVGLIMTIVCFFALIFFILDMQLSPVNKAASGSRSTRRQKPAQNLWSGVPPAQYGSYMAPPPVVALNQMVYPPPAPVPTSYDQPVYPSYSAPPPMPHHYDYNQQYNQQPYYQDYPMNSYYPDNSMIAYGNQGAAEQYYQHEQTPSPLISQLAHQYVSNAHDAQYADQLLYPYGYSNSNPYMINDYF